MSKWLGELYNNTCVLGQGPNDDDMILYLLLIIIDFQNFDIVSSFRIYNS